MVIAIEYMSDFFVGLSFLDPNLSGSSSSGGHQRRVFAAAVRDAAVVEFRLSATLVSPTSTRQASPSSETSMFAYTELSAVIQKRV